MNQHGCRITVRSWLPSNLNASVDAPGPALTRGSTGSVTFSNATGSEGRQRQLHVAVSAAAFVDAQRWHPITLRLENFFGEDYATGHGRGFPDVGGAPYVTRTLGVPRSLHVSYTFAY